MTNGTEKCQHLQIIWISIRTNYQFRQLEIFHAKHCERCSVSVESFHGAREKGNAH